MQACERGNTDVVELLVRKGAKVDPQDVLGQTATDYAKSAGHTGLISVLEMAPSTATWDIDDGEEETPVAPGEVDYVADFDASDESRPSSPRRASTSPLKQEVSLPVPSVLCSFSFPL
ncbi:ankycorbin-like isoform X1 [Branchiostoma lanceolatum]|uniref:ankycorbin-like isoform X1 n=1 Tax=Branchiostoma lanceolatum TaxID=7740 RepID=UPI003455C329